MIPKDEWTWYGFAGHYIGGRQCAYHLCTRIGDRMVSTVGAYYPDRTSDMQTLGIGDDDFFETMVFPCDGEDEHGNINILEWSEIESHSYPTSIAAEIGHRNICDRIAGLKQED